MRPPTNAELGLGAIFVLYLCLGGPTPPELAQYIDTIAGKLLVAALFLSLAISVHPMLGVLGLIVAGVIIARSVNPLDKYLPSEARKMEQMGGLNWYQQFPYTLEEEQVSVWTPQHNGGVASWFSDMDAAKPVPDNIHGAAAV